MNEITQEKATKIVNYDYLDFESWLISTYGYSKKTARDCISRCNRIEKHLSLNLNEAISKEVSFNMLLIDIEKYSYINADNKRASHAIKATLRASAKKYTLYKNPNWLKTTLNPIENKNTKRHKKY
jgi:hypothetical protein